MPERIKDFEGPDHVREELPPKRFAQLYTSDHISAPTDSRLAYVDGGPRRKRCDFVTGPSKYVETHVMDLDLGGIDIKLPNGHTINIKSAGKDHIQIRGEECLSIRPSCSNVLYVKVEEDFINTNPPSEEELGQ